jgi:hypothetical protein
MWRTPRYAAKEAPVTIFRIILIVVGLGLIAWAAYLTHRRRVMAATPTIGAGDVAAVADRDREVRVEVEGAADPGPAGPLTAPLSGTPCVWHRTVITRSYRKWETDDEGKRREVTGTNVVHDRHSTEPFTIVDVSGQVPVYAGDLRPDGAERVLSEREHGRGPFAGRAKSIGASGLGSGPGTTESHLFEEWVIRPGTNLYVLGAVRGSEGVAIRKPRSSPFIISTRGEEHLSSSMRTQSIVGYALGAIAVIGTIVWWVLAPGA